MYSAHTTISAQVKNILADSYWSDANDFLWRYRILKQQEFQNRSFLGKLYVDLCMAVECALKSSMIYLSPNSETPQQAYRIARSNSHNIQDSLSEVASRANHKVKFISQSSRDIVSKIKLSVSARYEIELLYIHLNSQQLQSSAIEQTIKDPVYMKALHKAAFDIFKFSGRCRSRKSSRAGVISMRRALKVQNAFQKLKLK